jgi:hypothetical protein
MEEGPNDNARVEITGFIAIARPRWTRRQYQLSVERFIAPRLQGIFQRK